MDRLTRDQEWQLLSLGSAVVAALAVRAAVRAGWRTVGDEDPPLNPLRQDSSWTDAVTFAALTGATVGLARLLARAIATYAWDRR